MRVQLLYTPVSLNDLIFVHQMTFRYQQNVARLQFYITAMPQLSCNYVKAIRLHYIYINTCLHLRTWHSAARTRRHKRRTWIWRCWRRPVNWWRERWSWPCHAEGTEDTTRVSHWHEVNQTRMSTRPYPMYNQTKSVWQNCACLRHSECVCIYVYACVRVYICVCMQACVQDYM